MPKHPFRTRIARAGLDGLMADPRYFDADHPEHRAMVDMVQRGFQMIFDEPKDRARRNPASTGPAPRPGLLDGALRDLAGDPDRFDSAPTALRQRQGRGVMLAALKADGFPLPSGLKDEDAPAVRPPTPRAGEGKTPERGPLAQSGTGARPGVVGRTGEPLRHLRPPRQPAALPSSPPTGFPDPWPASPVSKRFRDEIHKRESNVKDYGAVNGDAWGRYQLRELARKQIGLQRKDGSFTGKYGVNSRDDFLKNRKAQEQAFADYMADNLAQLKSKGVLGKIGQKISGIRANITVTENGLLAAAQRQGAEGTNLYLKHLERHGWKSDPSTFPTKLRRPFLAVETRLREFENIPHKK
ncbi:MAG: hypothetical protein E2O90_08620 [Alphaproteobacteria bacterium]|nr:MAG: hypothetical protein E2O90_08620 [Alphaproteobacteria bacterium]